MFHGYHACIVVLTTTDYHISPSLTWSLFSLKAKSDIVVTTEDVLQLLVFITFYITEPDRVRGSGTAVVMM